MPPKFRSSKSSSSIGKRLPPTDWGKIIKADNVTDFESSITAITLSDVYIRRWGPSALAFAIKSNAVRCFELLLIKQADINEDEGRSLCEAIRCLIDPKSHGNQFFLDTLCEIPVTQLYRGLYVCISQKNFSKELFIKLLDHPNMDKTSQVAIDAFTSVACDCISTNKVGPEFLDIMIERNIPFSKEIVLRKACYCKKYDLVKTLLNHGANIDATNHKAPPSIRNGYIHIWTWYGGAIPLIIAADSNNYKLMKQLISCGANVNVHGYIVSDLPMMQGTPLMQLCCSLYGIRKSWRGNDVTKEEIGTRIQCAKLLIEKGANLNDAVEIIQNGLKHRYTALSLAVRECFTEMVKLLIDSGATVDPDELSSLVIPYYIRRHISHTLMGKARVKTIISLLTKQGCQADESLVQKIILCYDLIDHDQKSVYVSRNKELLTHLALTLTPVPAKIAVKLECIQKGIEPFYDAIDKIYPETIPVIALQEAVSHWPTNWEKIKSDYYADMAKNRPEIMALMQPQ